MQVFYPEIIPWTSLVCLLSSSQGLGNVVFVALVLIFLFYYSIRLTTWKIVARRKPDLSWFPFFSSEFWFNCHTMLNLKSPGAHWVWQCVLPPRSLPCCCEVLIHLKVFRLKRQCRTMPQIEAFNKPLLSYILKTVHIRNAEIQGCLGVFNPEGRTLNEIFSVTALWFILAGQEKNFVSFL